MGTNIVIPDAVIKKLNNLPKEVRIKFWEQLERLLRNPSYPGLRNEKLHGTNQWAFTITMQYRASYMRTNAGIFITAIGTHKEVLGN